MGEPRSPYCRLGSEGVARDQSTADRATKVPCITLLDRGRDQSTVALTSGFRENTRFWPLGRGRDQSTVDNSWIWAGRG
jgi:hypothetical protein